MKSGSQPGAIFVVGTPFYIGRNSKPYNSAVVIKNGETIAVTHKRILSEAEEDDYLMDEGQLPIVVAGNAGILICRDALGASLPRDPRSKRPLLNALLNDQEKTERFMGTTFVHSDAQRLLIPSCWGIGMNPEIQGVMTSSQEAINRYYRDTLLLTIKEIFTNNLYVNEIFISDCSPKSNAPIKDRVSTKPISVIARRKSMQP